MGPHALANESNGCGRVGRGGRGCSPASGSRPTSIPASRAAARTARRRKIVFCGTFTAGGLQAEIVDGRVVIRKEGRVKKFVRKVEQITLSGRAAREKGQEILYATERTVFRLGKDGLELIEVAPGIDPVRDVLPQMEFAVTIPLNVAAMDPTLFREG